MASNQALNSTDCRFSAACYSAHKTLKVEELNGLAQRYEARVQMIKRDRERVVLSLFPNGTLSCDPSLSLRSPTTLSTERKASFQTLMARIRTECSALSAKKGAAATPSSDAGMMRDLYALYEAELDEWDQRRELQWRELMKETGLTVDRRARDVNGWQFDAAACASCTDDSGRARAAAPPPPQVPASAAMPERQR